MIGSSDHCADLLYATRFSVPDDFTWLEVGRRTVAMFSPLEVDRARRVATVDEVVAESEIEAQLPAQHKTPKERAFRLVEALLRREGVRALEVPAWMAAGWVERLRMAGFLLTVAEGPFFPQREIKRDEEIRAITRGQREAEAGMLRAWEVLRACQTGRGRRLTWSGRALTSELLRGEIESAVIRAGGMPARTIVAGGVQACDPHEAGHGPLRADEAIILDIFPRDQATGYFGDLTRTVVKGRASEALKRMHATVLQGQKLALREMRPGVDGARLHERIKDGFARAGYPTVQKNGRWTGFFHGTGHSLGLEIHEAPRFSAGKFKAGQVMTVEPGLYDPEIGGVRIEDLVVLKPGGIRNLTRLPKFLEL